ncbi:MAG: nucleotidyl transferase AbiEii/AbiGii toxin family protein [Candidatus Saccharicenans sp.]|nr:nucleotidyl transferase AbiEii/AbiGii toxin family protein [Candidatus Saccharicenans sp.]
MIDYQTIKSIAADKGVMEIVAEKDYILDWILWGISQDDYLKNNLVFKGGTALHKIYFSDWRFSEDLDFTTLYSTDLEKLQASISNLCQRIRDESDLQIKLKGIDTSGVRGEEWSFEVKLEYIGPRKQIGGNLPGVLLHITADEPIVFYPLKKMLLNPYEDLPFRFSIFVYSINEILTEKMRTVIYQRCFPRDVYDLWRLLREVCIFIDEEELLEAFRYKCQHRGINHDQLPDNLSERIQRLKDQWDKGLKRQLANPPEFGLVYDDLMNRLSDLFKKGNILARGGKEMIETKYVLRYKKGDIEIEAQGDKTFVETKFQELLNMMIESKKEVQPTSETVRTLSDKELSLGEFLKQKNPKSHGDKMLMFGYYLEKIKGYESFNIDDIEKCYQDVRLPKTKNFSPYIIQLIREEKIMESEQKKDNKKAWVLTKDGIEYVENYGSKAE